MTPTARKPRALIFANGQQVNGLVSFEVDNNSYYQADTYRCTLSFFQDTWAFWAGAKLLLIEIYAGFPPDASNYTKSDLTLLIKGECDEIEINPVSREIVLSGRDLTNKFIDTQTSEKFPNLTSSEIVAKIAAKHGLKTSIKATTLKSGTYYANEKAELTKAQSEWDLMTYLANKENYSIFVKGDTLYFQPKIAENSEPFVLQWYPPDKNNTMPFADLTHMSFSRSLTLAKDIIVEVSSYSAKTKKKFTVKKTATQTAKTKNAGEAQPVGDAQVYSRYKPNLTVQDAEKLADSLLRELTSHQVKLNVTMPADNLLQTETLIKVTGTGTAFDQTYYPSSIKRSWSFEGGYVMDIDAKNHSPESEVSS